MKVIVDTEKIRYNISKAIEMKGNGVSLMFKDFYEDIYPHVVTSRNAKNIYGLHINGSICYSIGKATQANKGALITSITDAIRCITECKIREFYIPLNAHDDREGLTLQEARLLAEELHHLGDVEVHGLITSGCMNEFRPTMYELDSAWAQLSEYICDISLGGSFWLGVDEEIPDYVKEFRIGEYMLFGTIPYNTERKKRGKNGITLQTTVIGVYPERHHILLDCGYSNADMDKCKCLDVRLQYVDSSSEYTIMYTPYTYKEGDVVEFIPNYKSLVKLRYARKEFI